MRRPRFGPQRSGQTGIGVYRETISGARRTTWNGIEWHRIESNRTLFSKERYGMSSNHRYYWYGRCLLVKKNVVFCYFFTKHQIYCDKFTFDKFTFEPITYSSRHNYEAYTHMQQHHTKLRRWPSEQAIDRVHGKRPSIASGTGAYSQRGRGSTIEEKIW